MKNLKIYIFIVIITMAFISSVFYFNNKKTTEASAPKTGLVGWWTMDANNVNGTTYYDKSGNNNNVTSSGSPPLAAGKIKQALNLQGSPQYASAPSAPFNFGTGNFSASMWIKSNNATATYSILDKYNANSADEKGWFIFESADVIKASIDNGSIDITGTAPIKNGVWYHVALVRNGNNAYTYVNGVQDGTVAGISARSATSAALLYIGVEKGTSQYFNGGIDDVRVYNYALSAQEVANLYSSAKTKYISSAPKTGLVGWWTMDSNDINGTTVYDKSGRGTHGTASSTPTMVVGKINQAISFNGSSSQISSSNSSVADFPASSSFTISAWIKQANNSSIQAIFGVLSSGSTNNYVAEISSGVLHFGNNASEDNIGTVAVSLNQWNQVAWVANGTNVTGYINGISVGTLTISNSGTASKPMRIGSRGINRYFNGSLDDVRIYNYALSAQEVANLYSSAKTKYIASAPRTGLVGWWTMDANDKSGSVYYDKSGRNNHATINSTPPLTTGKIKQALNLQGNPQYASAASSPFNFGTGNFTASVWIKPNNAAATYSILDKYNTNVADDRGWFILESANVIKASIDNGSIDITGTAPIRNGIWYHVVLVRNGDNAYTYVNGVQDGTVAGISARSATSAALLYIGVEKGTSQYFNGPVDDIRVYNRALSAAEVATLYSSAKTTYR